VRGPVVVAHSLSNRHREILQGHQHWAGRAKTVAVTYVSLGPAETAASMPGATGVPVDAPLIHVTAGLHVA
jgi:hypothetical protein